MLATESNTIMDFLRAGGPFMWVLVVTSIVAVTFIIERGLALRWGKVIPQPVEDAVERCVTARDVGMLRTVCVQQPSPTSRVLLLSIEHLDWPKAENIDTLQTRARHEIARLERGLIVLEIIVGIAPLLGLVGTIHGLITLFGDLGRVGLNDNAALARGIGIALNTTLAGLLIAIPSIIAWSYYTKKVETFAVEMESLCDEFLKRMYRQGRAK
jgi:biopolymer transport protein ExbB